MKNEVYNNVGICALAIMFILKHASKLSISKILLIMPFITHRQLLDYLSNSNSKIIGLEKLIIDKAPYFSNFNRRYYDSLCLSINSIQFLVEIGAVRLETNMVVFDSDINYEAEMGKRIKKIDKAASNIAFLLNEDEIKSYLNLRIEL